MNERTLDRNPLVVPKPEGAHKEERRPITPLDLLRLRDVNHVRISPDGAHVAFRLRRADLETNDYRTAWFVVGTEPGSPLVNVGGAGEMMWDDIGQPRFDAAAFPLWSPDSEWIVYLLKADGQVQLWRSHRDGSRQEQLTHNDADVTDFGFSPDGTEILFTTEAPRADLEAERARLYNDGIVIVDGMHMSEGPPAPDPSRTAVGQVTAIWVYELSARQERPATSQEQERYEDLVKVPEAINGAGSRSLSVSPDHTAVAFIATTGPGEDGGSTNGHAIYVNRLPEGETVELLPKPYELIEGLAWSPNGSELYFTHGNGDGADGTSISAVSVHSGAERRVLTSEYLVRQISVARSSNVMACVRSGLTEPDEVAVVDLSTGELRVLTELNPEFRKVRLSSARRLDWVNKYGDQAFGHLVEPLDYQTGKRYPLVVTTYRSYGFLRGGVGDEYPIQVLAANGFFVLSFDRPRGYSPILEFSPPPQDFEVTIRDWDGPASSLEEIVDKLVRDGLVDAERIGLCGLSNGAEITCYTISHSDRFHAAVASSGTGRDPFDYELMVDYRRWRERFACWGLNGDLDDAENRRRWEMLSPALNAARIQAPLLIQAADTECLYGLQMYNRLVELDKPVETIVYPDELHLKMQPRHRRRVYERNVDWFNFWLQGREDPDPAKAEQYGRWRALRTKHEKVTAASAAPAGDVLAH